MSVRVLCAFFTLFLFHVLTCSSQADQVPARSHTRTYHCLIRGDSTKHFTVRYAIIQSVTDSGFYYSAVKHGSRSFEREVRFMPARYIDEMKIGRKGKTGTGILVGGSWVSLWAVCWACRECRITVYSSQYRQKKTP
ncbi:hypothetical protein [Candidatus Pollutiaquabacter sp.]|uniref:hypothetical protein n=1 Tax=Candidatus Pollutiaquabacter sp. TaxID=3416354 RepID=UPI003C84B090|nr:hypothetical protein [Bacteroidota bacterium]